MACQIIIQDFARHLELRSQNDNAEGAEIGR